MHDITYGTAMTAAECKSDFKLTKDTPYLALKDELWGVDCEDSVENWPLYYDAALYTTVMIEYVMQVQQYGVFH